MPTAVVPPGQEGGVGRLEAAAGAAMPRRARGDRRAVAVARPGAPAEAHLRRDGVRPC
jgi:hypothetical protein